MGTSPRRALITDKVNFIPPWLLHYPVTVGGALETITKQPNIIYENNPKQILLGPGGKYDAIYAEIWEVQPGINLEKIIKKVQLKPDYQGVQQILNHHGKNCYIYNMGTTKSSCYIDIQRIRSRNEKGNYGSLSGIWPAVSSNNILFSCMNNFTASFQALFIGSSSNFNLAKDLNVFKSSLKTVAEVLTSSCDGLNKGFVFSAISSPVSTYYTSIFIPIYLLFSHSLNISLKTFYLHKIHKFYISSPLITQLTQKTHLIEGT